MSINDDFDGALPWLQSRPTLGVEGEMHRIALIASVLLDERRHLPIRASFPTIAEDAAFQPRRIGVRVHNALTRTNKTRFADIADESLDDVSNWKGIGAGAMRVFVEGLIDMALDGSSESSVSSLTAEPSWADAAADDLTTIARWQRMLGAEDVPVLTSIDHHSEPPEVRAARARLLTLTPAVILPDEQPELAASAVVDLALTTCSPRELAIAAERIFADAPASLDALGNAAGVTRERIRQQEAKLIERLREEIRDGNLSDLATAVREQIGSLIPLRTLLQRFPTLGAGVPLVGQPVWRVLDRLDDDYEIKDGWCASGSVQKRIDETRQFIRDAANGTDFVELDAIDDAPVDLDEGWMSYCGITVFRGYAFAGAATIPARAEVVLTIAGEALDAQTVLEQLGADRSLTSLKNALAADARFARVGRDRWALSNWGLDGYTTIRAMVGRAVDAAGGKIALQQLTVDLEQKFGVSATSVVSYASMFPFATEKGMVRRRTRRDIRLRRRKPLAQTRNLFRVGDSVRLAFTVTGEHHRGSGSVLPHAVGEELDLPLGGARDLRLGEGTILLSWRGPQITLGSLRSEVARLGLEVGDVAFMSFTPDGAVEIVPSVLAEGAHEAIAALTGGAVADADDYWTTIAERVDAAEPTRDAVRAVLAGRGDAQLAELVDALPAG